MPPSIQATREQILSAVMEIIDESGWEGVTARAVAAKLGTSTQPIYREFKDMSTLKHDAIVQGFHEYEKYIKEYAMKCKYKGVSQSVAYVRFAIDKSRLFKLLFESQAIEYGTMSETAHTAFDSTGIIDILMQISGLNREYTYKLHFHIWMSMHGLASLAANNRVKWTDEELELHTITEFRAMKKYFLEEQSNERTGN